MNTQEYNFRQAERVALYEKTKELLGYNLRWSSFYYITGNPVKIIIQNYLICLKSGRLKKYMKGRTKDDKKAKKYYVFLKTYLDLIKT